MDDLYAKAMVLSDGRTTVAIVSADLLYTPLEEITDPVRTIVHEKLGIPKQNIMVCATHTHSGPEIFAPLEAPAEEPGPRVGSGPVLSSVLVQEDGGWRA